MSTMQAFIFQGTAEQVTALTAMQEQWVGGGDFWNIDEILKYIESAEVTLLYIADGVDSLIWHGLIFYEKSAYSAELLYLFVHPSFRKKGLGKELLAALVRDLRQTESIEALYLEVRESNVSAQNLYRSLGMTEVGRRLHYYKNGEHALVYKLPLL